MSCSSSWILYQFLNIKRNLCNRLLYWLWYCTGKINEWLAACLLLVAAALFLYSLSIPALLEEPPFSRLYDSASQCKCINQIYAGNVIINNLLSHRTTHSYFSHDTSVAYPWFMFLILWMAEDPAISSLPSFLFGQSMGGAVALKVHLKQPNAWNGAILVAPMCKVYFSTWQG